MNDGARGEWSGGSLHDDSFGMTSALKETLHAITTKIENLLTELEKQRGVYVAQTFRQAIGKIQQGDAAGLRGEVLREVCWEKLHTGHWEDVSVVWRDAYALAQFVDVYVLLLWREGDMGKALKQLDLALMMGGNLFRMELETLIQKLGMSRKRSCAFQGVMNKKHKIDFGDLPPGSLWHPPGKAPNVECSPSLEDFCDRYLNDLNRSVPCVLKGLTKQWPAFEKWSLEYFHEQFGFRTVPVEIGRHYLADKWGQDMMTLTDFLTRYVTVDASVDTIGYLAQHPLFDQIPELKEDIVTPEYCCLSSEDTEPVIHAWFGPKGTVSPLHYDRSHNILAQVVGQKYVRLYAPSVDLHPIPSFMNKNSSQVDLDDATHVQRFELEKLEFVDLVLQPGDGLFIPRGWWHYVRSLDISFSVSFWWDRLDA